MKIKKVALILLVVVIVSMSSLAIATNGVETYVPVSDNGISPVPVSDGIETYTLVAEGELYGIGISPFGNPDQSTSRYFAYEGKINGVPTGNYIGVTVNGNYSQVDGYSEITSITAASNASGFSYSTTKSGNTGTIKLYINGSIVLTDYYTISTAGRISSSYIS